MILLAALAIAQDTLAAPVLEPGVNHVFKEAVLRVEESLEAGDFAKAKEFAARLPRQKMTIQWDDSTIPKDRRYNFEMARDAALKRWADSAIRLQITPTTQNPDILVTFTDTLPADPDTGVIQGAVFNVNYLPGEPMVEAVIALRRTEAKQSIETLDVENEVAYAIGMAVGLERQPAYGGVMTRTDGPHRFPTRILPYDQKLAANSIQASEVLRQAAADKKKMSPAKPQAVMDVRELNGGKSLQGQPMPMSFQITNRGNSPLRFAIVPDCSCFILNYFMQIEPGSTGLISVDINTFDFPGPLNKSLYLYTNDPDMPMRRIDVKGDVEYAYQFVREDADEVLVLGSGEAHETVYLIINDKMKASNGEKLQLDDVVMSGAKGSISAEEWSGTIRPKGGAPITGSGYKIDMYLEPSLVTGRYPVSITATTNDKKLFSRLISSVFVQNGIVAMPSSVYLGEIEQQPSRTWFMLSRPGKPFKVKSLKSASAHIKLSSEPFGTDLKIIVEFDGKAPIGAFSSVITVETDDPGQPTIQVPVQGVIR